MSQTRRQKLRPPGRNGCEPVKAKGCRTDSKLLKTIAAIVNDYVERFANDPHGELAFLRNADFATALEYAALAKRQDGKRQDHQRRLKRATLRRFHNVLKQCDLASCSTFEELHATIQSVGQNIVGIGPLTVYDTAVHLGAHLRLKPKKVYLHAGVREGANALGLGYGVDTLSVRELPPELRVLSPDDIESCLCIYKDVFKRIARKKA